MGKDVKPKKLTKKALAHAQYTARYFGAEAYANGVGFDDYKDDIALRYGFDAWAKMPAKLKSDALSNYNKGRQLERGETLT